MKENIKKDTFLKFRITEKEKLLIEERCKINGMNISEFSRFMLINGEVIAISIEERRVLAGLANNINQLVKLYHQKKEEPKRLLEELQNTLKELKDAYRRSS